MERRGKPGTISHRNVKEGIALNLQGSLLLTQMKRDTEGGNTCGM